MGKFDNVGMGAFVNVCEYVCAYTVYNKVSMGNLHRCGDMFNVFTS